MNTTTALMLLTISFICIILLLVYTIILLKNNHQIKKYYKRRIQEITNNWAGGLNQKNKINSDDRNVFLFWVGKDYKLISILRNLIYLHSTNGKGYKVHLINDQNLNDYINYIPDFFDRMEPAHKADYIRVNVVCEYGGIWLDSDTLVMDSMDSLFDLIETKNGFFIKETNINLCNGVFGSKKKTQLMLEWKNQIDDVLDSKEDKLEWTDIGSSILKNMNPILYDDYEIFNGLENLYPVDPTFCVDEYINKPYDNYKNIIREYQPLLILVNSIYKKMEENQDILESKLPINYFINKSFQNMKLIDYDFIEIGTSDFDTFIQKADDKTVGISVDAVKYYIDNLPDKRNVKKMNIGISDVNSTLNVYYIPPDLISHNNLPEWFRGCNSINNYHPLHIKYGVEHLCKIDSVEVITIQQLFYSNNVRSVKFLKIDTEGHDCIILKSLFFYIKYLPDAFYPLKILFESNDNTKTEDVDEIVKIYTTLGYKLSKRDHDTLLIYDNNI